MIKEAIEKIEALAVKSMTPQKIEIGGKNYIAHNGHEYSDEPLYPETLRFTTLSGLADYIEGGYDKVFLVGTPIIHVVSPYLVKYYGEAAPVYASRCDLAKAEPEIPERFPFGRFMTGEEFMIKLQALFVQGIGDWQDVVEACAGIKKQDGIEYKDSGVTQTVAVQSGLFLAAMKKLPNPVILAPYRTFPEIEQPASKFILRATDGRSGPELGLFEGDGGAWRLTAMEAISEWLKKRLPGFIVLS